MSMAIFNLKGVNVYETGIQLGRSRGQILRAAYQESEHTLRQSLKDHGRKLDPTVFVQTHFRTRHLLFGDLVSILGAGPSCIPLKRQAIDYAGKHLMGSQSVLVRIFICLAMKSDPLLLTT
jgi:hypothetical protein